MFKNLPGLLAKCVLFAAMCLPALAQCPTLVWSDEFDGTTLNEQNWTHELGGSGWGNNEWQFYRPENTTIENGVLKITAKQENYRGKSYTSSRIRTINKADFTYGRFEARIKLPYGQGIWPAFWMMPTDSVYGGWPKSGEIDIMENLGHELSRTYGTIHYGDPSHVHSGLNFDLTGGKRFTDDFHVWAIEKTPNEIRWYVDDILFLTKTPDDISPEFWPFEERFYFILNLAVGGNWPGYPDDSTVFPQVLEVDYVRVYDLGVPSMAGDRDVKSEEAGVSYSVLDAPNNTNFQWNVPAGASIVSGQGTDSVVVDWGLTGGEITVDLNNNCGTTQLAIDVYVNPPLVYDSSFENFDDPSNLSIISMDGSLVEIANPDTSGINNSAMAGSYTRNGGSLYDTIIYNINEIADASVFVSGDRRFFLDVYTTAPVGTPLILQLEDSSITTPDNYPAGRHSRYQAITTVQNGWERLEVGFLDRPDYSTSDTTIDTLVVLFAPNSFTSDTWTFDNLDRYAAQVPTQIPAAPTGLTAVSAGSSQINLTWSDQSSNENGFKIERSSNGVDFVEVATTASNQSSYSDTGLQTESSYTYRVAAFNNDGCSSFSNSATATTDGVTPGTTMYVSSITTGSLGAGKGSKYATATITIVDTNGNPVEGATVTGDFGGDYNETGTGITGSDGSISLVTQASAGGKVTITFCVTQVSHASLSYDAASNVVTCN